MTCSGHCGPIDLARGRLLLIGFLIAIFLPTPVAPQTTSNKVVIEYGEFEGHPLEMVIEGKRVSLRIHFDSLEAIPYSDEAFKFLRNEVVRLVTSENEIELGEMGFMFKFTSGCPLWGPTSIFIQGSSFTNLYFANVQEMTDGILEVGGRKEKPPFYHYPLFQEKPQGFAGCA